MPSLNAMAKEAKTKKSAAPKKAIKKVVAPISNLSTEFVQDSDAEQDEKSDVPSSSDDEESLQEIPAASAPKANGKALRPTVDSTSSSGSESESSEDSGSEDEEPSKAAEQTPVRLESAKQQSSKISTAKTVSFKEASPYTPPSGFELASLEDQDLEASQLFKKSNLEGKQIWYITAPASVPISSIQETSLAEINKGNAVLSHNGDDYGFLQDSSEDITYTKVLVPRGSDDSYRTGAKPIDRILHLQQMVELPSVYDANAKQPATSSTARPTIPSMRPVRQQPPGLKMRFRPIGFGNGSAGTIGSSSSSASGSGSESASDEEMEDAPPQFRRPASLEAEESATSSDVSDDDSSSSSDAEMADAPPISAVKSMSQKSTTKVPQKAAERPLKRKHSEGGKVKAQNSSSNSEAPTNSRELKTIKKKQTNSPADSQLASIEVPKITSSKLLRLSQISTTPTQPPKANRNRLPPSTQISASAARNTPVLPPKSSQLSCQASIVEPYFRDGSRTPSRDPLAGEKIHSVDSSAKTRKKEAERMKRDKSKLSLESDINESVTATSSGTLSGLSEPLSSQSQSLPAPVSEGKRHLKDKKGKEERKKTGKENGRVERSDSSIYSHSSIPPPIRSHSAIPPPKSTPRR